mmetsp:Transcript_31114/g.72437  ORF Transcript_31114/g.72437 Transcript_31114/m.72437 type:complete len:212 (-) Transcript_31114:2188-2823(-)
MLEVQVLKDATLVAAKPALEAYLLEATHVKVTPPFVLVSWHLARDIGEHVVLHCVLECSIKASKPILQARAESIQVFLESRLQRKQSETSLAVYKEIPGSFAVLIEPHRLADMCKEWVVHLAIMGAFENNVPRLSHSSMLPTESALELHDQLLSCLSLPLLPVRLLGFSVGIHSFQDSFRPPVGAVLAPPCLELLQRSSLCLVGSALVYVG